MNERREKEIKTEMRRKEMKERKEKMTGSENERSKCRLQFSLSIRGDYWDLDWS
jgi:hypothetical protein